jgi:hypothetical protein
MTLLARSLALAILLSGYQGAAKQYQQAKFVEYSTFSPCHHDCQPFDVVYFNFCFRVENEFLIGRTYAWKWEYDPSKMESLQSKEVSVRFDADYIWVVRTDGKELRLKRLKSSTHFMDSACNNPGR